VFSAYPLRGGVNAGFSYFLKGSRKLSRKLGEADMLLSAFSEERKYVVEF
jgi:hypothetical protein